LDFTMHLLAQTMPKNQAILIRNSMWEFWLKVEKPFQKSIVKINR
jgi:hypothetical protein